MKNKANKSKKNAEVTGLAQFVSDHKVLSVIMGSRLMKYAVKRPFGLIGAAVIVGGIVSYCLKKKTKSR